MISALAGPAAEALHYGNAAVEGDLKVIQRMAVDLGLSWSGTRLDEFRQRARDLVVRERRATAVLAAELLQRRRLSRRRDCRAPAGRPR